jgi:transcription elongation factor Elf1
MSTINEKMGMRPRTRTRRATHSRALVTDAKCPACGCQHVTENTIHGVRTRTCGMCSTQWVPAEES